VEPKGKGVVTAVLRTVTGVALVIGALLLGPPAGAAVKAVASASMKVASGSFGAIPTTTTSGTPSAGVLTLVFTDPTPAAQVFSFYNSGTLPLVATTAAVALSGSAETSTITVTLTACVGATWSGTTCSGTKTTIGSWTQSTSGTTDVFTDGYAAAARVSIEATVANSGSPGTLDTAVTLTVTSSPRQYRAAIKSNS
jgi:hypothetical protein